MQQIEIAKNDLLLNGKLLRAFECPIDSFEFFEKAEVIVVLLDSDLYKVDSQNVFSIDLNGEILWQIPNVPLVLTTSGTSPYTQIGKEGNNIKAFNWDGTILTLDPKSGELIDNHWTK